MNEAIRYCKVKISNFIEENTAAIGDTVLQEDIIRLLKEKVQYNDDKEALELFEKSWEKSIN